MAVDTIFFSSTGVSTFEGSPEALTLCSSGRVKYRKALQ
jgi:hypothetical protein